MLSSIRMLQHNLDKHNIVELPVLDIAVCDGLPLVPFQLDNIRYIAFNGLKRQVQNLGYTFKQFFSIFKFGADVVTNLGGAGSDSGEAHMVLDPHQLKDLAVGPFLGQIPRIPEQHRQLSSTGEHLDMAKDVLISRCKELVDCNILGLFPADGMRCLGELSENEIPSGS